MGKREGGGEVRYYRCWLNHKDTFTYIMLMFKLCVTQNLAWSANPCLLLVVYRTIGQ